jgi:DNA-3-methyladenine glycosylase II
VGSVADPVLACTLCAEAPLTAEMRQTALERIRFFLSLDDNLVPFYAVGERDPAFAPIIDRLFGYHQVKFLTPFESACWAVLSQRNTLPLSQAMKARLTERYGGVLFVDSVPHSVFPDAHTLASADESELHVVVGNRMKSDGIMAVARGFVDADEEWLRNAPYDDASAWLRGIKGIGAWSASFILLRGLGRAERLPVEEKWVLSAAQKVYGEAEPDLERLAAPYGNYAGYWAHYLRIAV